MLVHEPEATTTSDEVRVEAAIDLDGGGAVRPPSLWFVFPRAYERFVTGRTDAFAVALLPLAMSLGEEMTVRGTLSNRLAAGMREYQRIQSVWKPGLFRRVAVEADALEGGDPAGVAGAVGTAFSGGVDSFHTLRAHLPENEPFAPFRVTHCVMVNGFDDDSDLADTGSFRALRRLYEPVAAANGLELLVVRTNLLEFLGPRLRAQSFAAFLTAPALALGGLFSRYYVSSGCKVTTLGLYPDGSHLMLDHLLSTETMETSHEGGHLTRLEKTVAISQWPETYSRLRVCFRATGVQEGREAVANCCACEKCLRTMVTLELAGALPSYTCFPKPLTRRAIRSIDFGDSRRELFVPEIIAYAEQVGRREVARDLRIALLRTVTVRAAVRAAVRAGSRLEKRSGLYASLAAPSKRLLRRAGFGRGWLY